MSSSTSAVLVIGNEILSGRTKDINVSWLGEQLAALGIPVRECRIVPDVEVEVVAAVNALRDRYTYVFTTGGIGPTHDDITTACVAKAFGVPVIRHPEAVKALQSHYTPDMLNAARLKMADVPEGSTLIANPVSKAPGFRMSNVFVLAGVPRIMQAMFGELKGQLTPGVPVKSETMSTYLPEGTLAERLSEVQSKFPEVEIGSYPFIRQGRIGTSLVARSTDSVLLQSTTEALRSMIAGLGGEIAVDLPAEGTTPHGE